MAKPDRKSPKPGNNNSVCQKPALNVLALAEYNAKMALTKMPSRCADHNEFHNWAEPGDTVVHAEKLGQARKARITGYVRQRDGKYLPETKKSNS